MLYCLFLRLLTLKRCSSKDSVWLCAPPVTAGVRIAVMNTSAWEWALCLFKTQAAGAFGLVFDAGELYLGPDTVIAEELLVCVLCPQQSLQCQLLESLR